MVYLLLYQIRQQENIQSEFMKRILVYHTAAIGDSVLATPVSVSLKKAYPEAKLTYATHDSLIALLRLCPAIDDFVSIDKAGTAFDLRKKIQELKPDLLVDLSGSSKSFWQTIFLAPKTLHYKKQENTMHAVENYLSTVSSLAAKPPDQEIFPTLFIPDDEKEKIRKIVAGRENRRLLALVPGVGNHRPHRAWPEDHWVGLGKNILWEKDHAIMLLGGPDERTLCSRIAEKIGDYCFNLAGKLTLTETAAALSLCDGTVSGDTGPAHISAAVGTPVVGLYGPTLLERSGPFGWSKLSLSAGGCKCQNRKNCSITGNASGKCMKDIPMKLVYGNLSSLFPWNKI